MRKLYLLILPILLISSCSDEVVNPISNYTWPVVQCLINYDDSVHYLRLGKTFSGTDLDAMIHNPDSLYYKEAKVYFDIIKNDHLIETIQLEETDELKRDPGFFPETPFRLYKTDSVLTPGIIHIRIELPEENKYVLTGIDIMGEPQFYSPDPLDKKFLYFYGDAVVRIGWYGCDASAETIVRFWYLEHTENGVDTCKLDWIRRDTAFILEPNPWFDLMLHSIKDDYHVLARTVLQMEWTYFTREFYKGYLNGPAKVIPFIVSTEKSNHEGVDRGNIYSMQYANDSIRKYYGIAPVRCIKRD